MKKRIDKLVVLLFVLAMCFLMSISAHAETANSYFFTSTSLPSKIELDGVTITPTNVNGQVKADSKTIFNENVSYYARVKEAESTTKATKFTINAQSKGVLLVYYTRSWSNSEGPSVNDVDDLNIEGVNGFAQYCNVVFSPLLGVKYYILDVGTYTMTAPSYTCGVYGFVYMPGNVAVYDVKGKGDLSLIGQFCTDYTNLPDMSENKCRFEGWYKDEAYTIKVNEEDAITEPSILFARWTRFIWDFKDISDIVIEAKSNNARLINYDGILIKGSVQSDGAYTCFS